MLHPGWPLWVQVLIVTGPQVTAGHVAGLPRHIQGLWDLSLAYVLGDRATRVEVAARGRMDRTGNLAAREGLRAAAVSKTGG